MILMAENLYMVGVTWVMPRSVEELIFSWKSGARRRRHKDWKVIL